jgi:hypothetical protein
MVGAIPWSVERSGGESSERGAVHACNRAIASRVHGHRHQGDGCGSVHGDSCGSGGGPGHRRDACRCGGRASSVPGAGRTRPDSVRRSSAAARLSERGACRGVATFVDVARSDGRSAIPTTVRARQVTSVKPALWHMRNGRSAGILACLVESRGLSRRSADCVEPRRLSTAGSRARHLSTVFHYGKFT